MNLFTAKLISFINIYLLCLILNINCTLSPPAKGKRVKLGKELKANSGPVEKSVFQRNLIDDEPAAKDILVENEAYYRDTSKRLFDGTILGYVTPWNNHGYDVAKIFGPKFDIISPVWLQITRQGNEQYALKGSHDIDTNWMEDVRRAGPKNERILPRIILDKFREDDYSKLLTYDAERKALTDLIVRTCMQYAFDGIVLELWTQLAGRVENQHLLKLVEDIARPLKNKGFDFVLVVPAPRLDENVDYFTKDHFERLLPLVTAFSLVTYDFSSAQRPGANAPLYWMKSTIEHICPETSSNWQDKRKKLLLGFNLYGYDYSLEGSADAIVGRQFLESLKLLKGRLTHDEHDEENFFEVKKPTRHVIFYPTLYSINKRIELARELGVGISLWELGQGLDYFYDLF